LLTAVQPPTLENEAVRDLARARDDAREDLQRCRHRLGKMLPAVGNTVRSVPISATMTLPGCSSRGLLDLHVDAEVMQAAEESHGQVVFLTLVEVA
jgi:hypothetical protein